jgi:hypothetical protein
MWWSGWRKCAAQHLGRVTKVAEVATYGLKISKKHKPKKKKKKKRRRGKQVKGEGEIKKGERG